MALGIGLLFLVLYVLSPRPWAWGDSTFLLNRYADGQGFWMHLVYLPAARVLHSVVPGALPLDVLCWTSAVGAAVGLAFSFWIARRAGAGTSWAAGATALFGLAPAVWFFAVLVEVHGTQLGALAVGAWLTLVAPWRHLALALAMAALGLALAYAGHQSALALGPGWVLLAGFAASRQGVLLSAQRLLFLVGPVLLAALLAADALTVALGQQAVVFGNKEAAVQFATVHHNPPSWGWWRRDVAEPLGWALGGLLLGAAGVLRARMGVRELAALAALVLVPGTVFAMWAVNNRGGYLAAAVPFLVWWCARGAGALPRWLAAPALLLLLALQAQYGWRDVDAESRRFDRTRHEQRARAAEAALPNGGLLLSIDPEAQDVRRMAPSVKEMPWLGDMMRQRAEGLTPEAGAERLLLRLSLELGDRPLAIDLQYRAYLGIPADERLRDLMRRTQALEAGLFERYTLEPLPESPWPMARLHPR